MACHVCLDSQQVCAMQPNQQPHSATYNSNSVGKIKRQIYLLSTHDQGGLFIAEEQERKPTSRAGLWGLHSDTRGVTDWESNL